MCVGIGDDVIVGDFICDSDRTGVVHRSPFESDRVTDCGGEGAGAVHKSSSESDGGAHKG